MLANVVSVWVFPTKLGSAVDHSDRELRPYLTSRKFPEGFDVLQVLFIAMQDVAQKQAMTLAFKFVNVPKVRLATVKI